MEVKTWIETDETALEMLSRVSSERPCLLLPPLHRLPLRVGNVIELVGPSPSAKTLVLTQAVVSCVLPKEWNGVRYGGLERVAMFVDLDCRFDVLCLSEMLKRRIIEANGSSVETNVGPGNVDPKVCERGKSRISYDEELHSLCMGRFLYIRCYDSFEFLATLKTLHHQLNRVKEAQNNSVYLLMIDSIGAFHWVDRASNLSLPSNTNRKSFSLQSISETVVQELKKLLLVHPILVIATKAINLSVRFPSNDFQRKKSIEEISGSRKVTSTSQNLPYREYMPAVWQSFVTHRILVYSSDDQNSSVYFSEWLMPRLNILDRFVVKNGLIHVV